MKEVYVVYSMSYDNDSYHDVTILSTYSDRARALLEAASDLKQVFIEYREDDPDIKLVRFECGSDYFSMELSDGITICNYVVDSDFVTD